MASSTGTGCGSAVLLRTYAFTIRPACATRRDGAISHVASVASHTDTVPASVRKSTSSWGHRPSDIIAKFPPLAQPAAEKGM